MENDAEIFDVMIRIHSRITNPALNDTEKWALAKKWGQLIRLVAGKFEITPMEVQVIVEDIEDSDGPISDWEPDEKKTPEEEIYWEYMQEIDLIEAEYNLISSTRRSGA